MPAITQRRLAPPRGFTLVELIIVVLVLAIAAAIVVPAIGTAADVQVVSAARVLASDLETTRSLALTTQQPHTLVFSTDRGAYKVVVDYGGEPYASVDAVEHPVRAGRAYETTVSEQQGMRSVAVTNVDFGGDAYVTFDAQGEPFDSGNVTLQAGDVQMIVSVESLTGIVNVTRID